MGKAKRTAVLLGLSAALFAPAATAHAQECVYPANCEVDSTVEEEVRADSVTAPSNESVAASGATLPVTGGDAVGLAVIGAGALGAGALLVRRTRRTD